MDYCLETISLCKKYGNFKALNGLSMHIPKGAIYGLIGKNGAGKTTLIRLIILDFANMMELFQEYDVEFVSSTEKFDTSNCIFLWISYSKYIKYLSG